MGSDHDLRQPRQDLPVRPKLPARVEEKLEGLGLSKEEVNRAMQPMFSFRAQLEGEVEWYERVPACPNGLQTYGA